MKFLYRFLRQDPEEREGVVIATSALGILVNLALASVKIVAGIMVSSIAIISEGVNNATDCATSLITIAGTKLSGRRPTSNHPFGFGRVEYLTSLVVAVIVFVTGIELIISSVKIRLNPDLLSISYFTLALIALSAVVKLVLGGHTVKEGKRVGSEALVALGTDCRNDSLVSAVTIVSSLAFLLFDVTIDAYAGVITSLFVLKTGYGVLRDTLSDLLGKAGDKELADELYKIILAEPIVLNAADMMLHNYGPKTYSGSVNIEIDHEKTIGEAYSTIHALQLRIMHQYDITMVFGMYAVDTDHEEVLKMRREISAFVRGYDHVQSYHALYVDPENGDIYVDLVVDFDLKDWDRLRENFTDYMNELYPGRRLELVIETNYV